MSDAVTRRRSFYEGYPVSIEDLNFLFSKEIEPLFWFPDRLGRKSAWWGHVPFASWLTAVSKPRVLVELGAHDGVSYAAFCEAVLKSQNETRCYAFDGSASEMSGRSNGTAFDKLEEFHDRRYAAFSHLLPMKSGEACKCFEPGTIDLLHIGDCPSYDVARNELETWRPKLSDRAIVLIHNIHETGKESGVGRFFRELKSELPAFEFLHSQGLGIVVIGADAPAAVRNLSELADDRAIAAIRERFSHFGARWAAEDTIRQKNEQIAQLKDELASRAAGIEELKECLEQVRESAAFKDAQIAEHRYHLERINASPWWRLGMWVARRIETLLRIAKIQSTTDNVPRQSLQTNRSYQKWVELYDTISEQDRQAIKVHIQGLAYQPLISIVMPAYETPENLLREAIASVRSQLYRNWELCIVDDGSPSPTVARVLAELSACDSRIKWMRRESNGHISEASNFALTLASGEFVALMDHDDLLAEHALYEVVAELNRHPDADLIYSDEDRINDAGVRHSPYFKTDWNPELFLGQNMISHLGVYRRSILDKVGGFRVGYEGSQDYDLALRVVNVTRNEKIRHIPAVLYHWRGRSVNASFSETQLQQCVTAARRAKADYFSARGEAAKVLENPFVPSWEWIRRPIQSPSPLVSLIVPTRNRHDLLGPCLDGLLNRTNYQPIEVIIIDHESDHPETIALLDRWRADERVRIIRYEGDFNYSDMNNKAVTYARGEMIGLINNDIDVINSDWLSEMVSLAALPENGAIGAKLLYPNDLVQHAGVALGMTGGIAGHMYLNAMRHEIGYFGRLVLSSNVSAVTGACLVVRAAVFEEVGGLNSVDLPVSYNDVDLCLRIQAKGYRNVWTPFALLYHHESPSRGPDTAPDKIDRARREVEYIRRTWGDHLNNDPFFNPNLSLQSCSFELAFPPRRVKPWLCVGVE